MMIARCNPFRSERMDQLVYRWNGTTLNEVMERLQVLNYRAAIVGPDGSGKTTLLETLAKELASRGFHVRKLFLNQELASGDARATKDEIVLFDGADLMDDEHWYAFVEQTPGGLIITSHREGLLPALVQSSTSLQLLTELVQELSGASNEFPLEKLFRRHNGNLRDVLRALYDLCAEQGIT